MLQFLADVSGVTGVFSTSDAGNMKLRGTDEDAVTRERQRAFLASAGLDPEAFYYAYVSHGTEVGHITSRSPREIQATDALVTATRGVYLGLTVADCFPVFFSDPIAGVCGVAHAGWRGTVKKIIPLTIKELIALGATQENIQIEVGPGISADHFDFHFAELIQEFGEYAQDKYIHKDHSELGKVYVDLQQIILDQVAQAGVPEENVRGNVNCTFKDDERFFSARRHQGDSHSAMLAVIGMDPV